MSGRGHQDGERSGGRSRRAPDPYIAPPHIRTTGEIPAITGEVPATRLPDPYDDGTDPSGSDQAWPPGGSVVDRPPPSPPDWMSGVQVPELLVTRELDPSELARHRRGGFGETAQRVVGVVLVAILVAVVVLVLVSSIPGF